MRLIFHGEEIRMTQPAHDRFQIPLDSTLDVIEKKYYLFVRAAFRGKGFSRYLQIQDGSTNYLTLN